MLDDILESVRQAEGQAEASVARAEEAAAQALRDNQRQIEAKWADGKERARSRRAYALSEAEVHATRQAEHIAAEYAAECERIRTEGMAKVDGLVDYLTEIVFDGGC